MKYLSYYNSVLGKILIISNSEEITALYFKSSKYSPKELDKDIKEEENSIIKKTKKWLDIYFSGEKPEFNIQINPFGTEFQKEVWKLLCDIPYGKIVTYKEIAKNIAIKRGIKVMSSQAVGGAVSKNPISIIIPCHRVVGTNKKLVGYSSGIDIKQKLLEIEKIVLS